MDHRRARHRLWSGAPSRVAVVSSIVRSQLRVRPGGVAALALLVALLAGSAAALVAGSRRSATVVARYFGAATPYVAEVFAPWLDAAVLEGIPGVERADVGAYIGWSLVRPDGSVGSPVNGFVLADEGWDPTLQVVEGRRPDPAATFEAVVNEPFSRQFGLGMGDTVRVRAYAHDQQDELFVGVYEPRGPTYQFRIVGIGRPPSDIGRDEVSTPDVAKWAGADVMVVTTAFYEAHRQDFLDFGPSYDVLLVPGAVRDDVMDRIAERRPEGGAALLVGPPRFIDRRSAIATPTRLETNAMLALGLGVAVVGSVGLVLLQRIDQRSRDREAATLAALGLTRLDLGVVAAVRNLPAALGGAVLAPLLAYLFSDRFPIGIGRQVELSPGRQANVAVLAGTAVVVVAGVIGAAFALGLERSMSTSARTSRAAVGRVRLVGRVAVPVQVTSGMRLAGADAGTTRPATAAAALSLAVVVALGVLAAGIDRLYRVGEAHGWPIDVLIGNLNFPMGQDTAEAVASHERIAAATLARFGGVRVDGVDAALLAIQPGTAPPVVVSGDLPRHPDEIALGRSLLRRLGASIGSSVVLDIRGGEFDDGGAGEPVRLQVTGAVLPPSPGEAEPADMGVVLAETIVGMRGITEPQMVLARVRGDPAAAARALDDELGADVTTHIVPASFANLRRIRHLPIAGAVLGGMLGTVVLGFTAVSTVRRHRTDLAVLRALGMTTGQLRSVLAAHGCSVALAVLAIGVPLGVVLGTPLWRRVAIDVGASDHRELGPWLALVVPAVAAVGLAVGSAALWRSRRSAPALDLRRE